MRHIVLHCILDAIHCSKIHSCKASYDWLHFYAWVVNQIGTWFCITVDAAACAMSAAAIPLSGSELNVLPTKPQSRRGPPLGREPEG